MEGDAEKMSDERFVKFTALILDINRSIQRIKSEEMEEFALNCVHVNILFQLDRNKGGLSQAELVKLCGEDKAYISRSVASLVERGIVTVGEGGSKKYNAVVKLTECGADLAARTVDKAVRAVKAGSAGLTDADRDVFYKCLERVAENLDKYVVGDNKQ